MFFVTTDFIINPIIVAATLILGVFIGYLIGRGKVIKSQLKIEELEKEMMSSHAEILEIQKAYVALEQRMKEHSIPVIAMKLNGKDTTKEKASK